jgi:hypothetical protein
MTNEELIQLRRDELSAYQNNIDNFNAIIATLPSSLPSRLESYRSRTDKHEAAAEIQDLDDVKLVSDVWFHDELQARIRSEIVEMRKVEAILAVLESN